MISGSIRAKSSYQPVNERTIPRKKVTFDADHHSIRSQTLRISGQFTKSGDYASVRFLFAFLRDLPVGEDTKVTKVICTNLSVIVISH